MTDPSDSLSLAEHGAKPRDLPQPPALRFTPQTALFLDFDGTLIEIADHPDEVIVPPSLPGLVTRLAERLEGRLAIVSGRSIAALEDKLGPRGFNELDRLVQGISRRMLTRTLRSLEADGLISRRRADQRVEYALTELGQTLREPIVALTTWARVNGEAVADFGDEDE